MKSLYLECNMGVAGDMLCASLLDTLNEKDKEYIINKLNTLLCDVTVNLNTTTKSGIRASKFDVTIKESGHTHTSISEIYNIINSFDIPQKVKKNAKAVYKLIAEAESKVHGTKVADVHLHEVGAKDAIIDITACCLLIDYLQIDKIVCSPIATGYGEVKTAHGIMPVPAPATAELLSTIPCFTGDIKSELTTPTGVALVKFFANEFSASNGEYEKVGYGAGTKDFEKPNIIRTFIKESDTDTVFELRCQIDDMTGEELGYALNKMLTLGSKDAYIKPIVMKKSRPAFEFTVISSPADKDELTRQMFKHTTTLGIRQIECVRAILEREICEKNGVRIKRSQGYGTQTEKIEFDDIVKIAEENDISVFEAKKMIKK
ncbi:nickel pincer cofactor biosynthesis protein LarC [uncultured Eubacterium sp.]|uniref:nickel pincer cofactor biosynthesis protein LarC n=1 Tax=uncultured Eubacterium sp. TaxID=165185 RepID=UPI0028038DB2|nr:nickel pincer cofactor biosynthesis protein LarC [uncultured Eubacterium sp.]